MKMSMEISGLDEVKKLLSKERIKKVLVNSINDTARLDAKPAIVNEMKKSFDRPTPFTLNSVYTRLNSAEMSVEIGLKEWGGKGTPASEYLQPQIFGGSRPMKRSERHLGSYYIPGSGARLNQYGNIPASQLTQILSALGAFPEVGYAMNVTTGSRKRNKKPRNFFMIRHPGHGLHPGVYEKMANGSVKGILIYIGPPTYEIKLKWFEVIQAAFFNNIQRRFNENFNRAFTAKLI